MRVCLLLLAAAVLHAQTYDLVISSGRVVDGAGNPWFYGDIGIRGDRIARVASAGALQDARNRIDARGLAVAPGFIDIQGASQGALLNGDGRVISHVGQGITTEIMGEGWTAAPSNEKTLVSQESLGRAGAAPRFEGPHGFDAWLRAMDQHGASVNFGSFVGAATVRQYVMGMRQGEATAAELEQMQTLVRNAMLDGAFGIGSALIYPPGNYANTRELTGIAKAMAPFGGIYITHMRSEADHLIESIQEALTIGRDAGVPVEIYHLKAAGRRNWSKMTEAIALIEGARRSGQDAGADMYPYTAGATGLTACFPPWTAADGKLFDNLADPAIRAKIRAEMAQQETEWENMGMLAGPENILIVATNRPENRGFAGKRLSEIAQMQKKDWRDAAMDLVLTERRRVETIYFLMTPENLAVQLKQPWIKVGTDSAGVNPETGGLTHPRSYGTFPRILCEFVREKQVMPLEEAIRKMTSATARRLSIPDRGLLLPGLYADVVVFDPQTIADVATYEKPHQLPTGIRYVIVNGTVVMKDGVHTGAKPGKALRGPGYAVAN
ncbi:MAG TPA: D-aminoacylase [Candidatus Solibacter sp.]|nr:D-aminoacylase [Candidatus Solibacter sp.]